MFQRGLSGGFLGLALLAATLTTACRYQPMGPVSALPEREMTSLQFGASSISGVLLGLAMAAGLGAAWWLRRRRARAKARGTLDLDRQDMALLRTSVESVVLLLRRLRRRLKLLNWRGPGSGL